MKRMSLALGSLGLVLGLLLSACAPAAGPPLTPTVAPPLAPTPTVTPAKPTPAPPAEKPRYGGILKVSHPTDPAHFDIHQEKTYAIQQPLAPIYSLLVQSDTRDGTKIVPDLAERWEISPDGKVYTFHLRQGVKFHNGQPLTAADVKASFDRIIWPPKGVQSPRQEAFQAVEKIETPGKDRVSFVLKFPYASFPSMAALPFNFIFPKPILDAKGNMKKDIMGSGPFKFKEYIRGVSFAVEKNPDYFIKGLPYLDGVVRYIIPDLSSVSAALRTGQVQMALGPPQEFYGRDKAGLKQAIPGLGVQTQPKTGNGMFFPNHQRKPWSDVRVRKAVELALDRDALIAVVLQGEGVVGGHLFPGPWGIPEEELRKRPGYRQPKDQDLAEAKRLLAEAGYPQGFKATLTTRSDVAYLTSSIVVVKDHLMKIGIDAKLELVLPGVFYSRKAAGEFEALSDGFALAVPDPDLLIAEQYLTTSPANWGRHKNPKIDELFEKQLRTPDPAERKRVLREIEEILFADVARSATFWPSMTALSRPEVRNFIWLPSHYWNMHFREVWLAQ